MREPEMDENLNVFDVPLPPLLDSDQSFEGNEIVSKPFRNNPVGLKEVRKPANEPAKKTELNVEQFINITCPEHNIQQKLHEGYELLVYGQASHENTLINWCQVVKASDWYNLMKNVINNNPFCKYSYESIFGKKSEVEFTLLELIGNSNMCCCISRINACRNLNVNLGLSIYDCIKDELKNNNNEGLSGSKKKSYTKKNNIKQYTKSFYYALNKMANQEKSSENAKFFNSLIIAPLSEEIPMCNCNKKDVNQCNYDFIKEVEIFKLTLNDKTQVKKFNRIIKRITSLNI